MSACRGLQDEDEDEDEAVSSPPHVPWGINCSPPAPRGRASMPARWHLSFKKPFLGVPVVAQWLTNPTRNHEVAGSAPALAQRVNDPALP